MPGIDFGGYDFLGSTVFTSSRQSSDVVAIPARDILQIQVRVTGYSGGDIASLRFNGDTAANYWSRYISWASGGTTATNAQNASQTLARLFAQTTTMQRSATIGLTNYQSTSKVGNVSAQTSSNSASTIPVTEFGGFEWNNTTAQITSIQLLTAGGSITMPAGTGFAVFGRNL